VLTFGNERAVIGTGSVMADIAARFVPRADDLHIVTYPKAGTSWIQELAWLVNHNADTAAARAVPSGLRTTYIELVVPGKDKLALLRDAQSPRHVKWHHSAWLLPAPVVANGKIIYLYRNPKDLVVSWYHFQRLNPIYGFEGSFDQFFDHFLADNVAYGSYWENLRSWWVLRDTPNVLVLSYEEMHADLQSVTHQVARFLNKELTDAQVESIVQHCSLDSMRANPMTNASAMPAIAGEGQFLRKGQVGNWQSYFSAEQSKLMDEWIERHNSELSIPFVYTVN